MAKRSGMFQQLSTVKGCRPFTLGCLTFVLLLVGLFIFFAVFEGLTTLGVNTDWNTNNHQTIRMRTERGVMETVHIGIGQSIQGNWATQGLQLSISGNVGSGVVPFKDVSWPQQITVKCPGGNTLCPTGGPMVLDGSFTVPDIAGPAAQTVTGHITGTVYWPRDLGNGTFDTKSTDVDVTVQMVLGTFSPYEAFMRGQDSISYAGWTSFGIAIIVAVYLAIRYRIFLKRQPIPVALAELPFDATQGANLPSLQGLITSAAQRQAIWGIQQSWKRAAVEGLYAAHVWNQWRLAHPDVVIDLHGDSLSLGDGSKLDGINLSGANLSNVNLRSVSLNGVNLSGANLTDADLRNADLRGANLYGTNLSGANLSGQINLDGAILSDESKYPETDEI